LLAPLGHKGAFNIEEGLATHLSHIISARHALGYRSNIAACLRAEADVIALLAIDPQALRKIREREISFNKMTSELLTPGAPSPLARGTEKGKRGPARAPEFKVPGWRSVG